jgi:hypothetical protein
MKAVKAVGLLGALVALMLAGCGDGSIKSPDFQTTTTVTAFVIQPAQTGQGNSLPAGTSLAYRAIATYQTDAPPGQPTPAPRNEDVTARVQWTSANNAVATVDQGVVTGKAQSAAPVEITATLDDAHSAKVAVTVTAATLTGVVYAGETNVPRASDDRYTVAVGNTVQFQLYGRFSDQAATDAPRPLDADAFGIEWTSNAPDVADNPAGDANFQTLGAGNAVITGTVTKQPGAATTAGINPVSASATLVSQAANAFCEREFRAPAAKTSVETSAACVGCSVADPDLVIDGDIDSEATMSIPLSLLTSATVSLNVSDAGQPLTVGKSVGLVISRSADILSAELLSTLQLQTVICDVDGKHCETQETFDASNDVLHLNLLGLIGSVPQYLLSTPPITKPANGVRLSFNGGLVGLIATLHVQSACAATAATTAP